LLARENPFREVEADEEESNEPLAFAKSGFSSVLVVFIIVMLDSNSSALEKGGKCGQIGK